MTNPNQPPHPGPYQQWLPQPGQQPPPPPVGGPVQHVVPTAPPPSGVVEVKVNKVLAITVGVLCIGGGVAFGWWLWYRGELWQLDNDDGSSSKGTILFHLLPLILAVIGIVFLARLLQAAPKLVFEPPGVRIRDKAVGGDGYRRVPWSHVGRVTVTSVTTGRRSTARHWVVVGRDGTTLGSVAVAGHQPDPEQGLGQIAAVAAGRAQVG